MARYNALVQAIERSLHSIYKNRFSIEQYNFINYFVLAQARTNLDPDESVIFVYDGAPAHRNPTVPAPNTKRKMLLPYSPFLNIVEQAISCVKAAIKADISCLEIQRRMDNRDEARARGIPLGEFRTQQLLEETSRLRPQLKVRSGTVSCRPICQDV